MEAGNNSNVQIDHRIQCLSLIGSSLLANAFMNELNYYNYEPIVWFVHKRRKTSGFRPSPLVDHVNREIGGCAEL